MYIAKMVIGSPPNAFAEFLGTPPEPFPPFTEPVEFQFDEQVNLFVGPNATGKSSLLAKLFERLARGIQGIPDTGNWGLLEITKPSYSMNNLALIAIPATRIGYGSGQSGQALTPGQALTLEDLEPVIAGSLSLPLYAESVQCFVDEIRKEIGERWQDRNALWADAWYDDDTELDIDEYVNMYNIYRDAGHALQYALTFSYNCAREVCDEILIGDAPHDSTIVNQDVTDAGLPTVSATLAMGARVQTSDPAQRDANAQPLAIEQLSAGTQGTLWWIRLIALILLKSENYQDGWEKGPAILLIDEIENHLHPTWQRRVIPALLKYFPGLQIFATTHSPFVVAGLKAGQVHILQRDADSGVITASTNTEDIVGWTMDEILRAFMGVADPTDDATAAAARELRHLRNDGPAADAEDEERRQTRMQHLRRQVDRDLLAGGPKARRREEFAQQFAEALEKRRQEQSLNQDGG